MTHLLPPLGHGRETDPLHGVCPQRWKRVQREIRTKLSGKAHSFASACECLFGEDERVCEGPSLLFDINTSLLSPEARMRGLIAREHFFAYEPVAVLGTDARSITEDDTRMWHHIGDDDRMMVYTDDDLESSGWLVNSCQGKVGVGDDGVEYDQFFDINCAFVSVRFRALVDGKSVWRKMIVVVTTHSVQQDGEFVTYYPLPLAPPFLWRNRPHRPMLED